MFFSATLFMLTIAYSCKPKDDNSLGNKLGEIEAKADPVRTEGEIIATGDFELELVSNGKLATVEKASLFFSTNQLISDIYVQNGDWVSKGTLLAVVDTTEAALALQQAKLSIEKARLELRSQIIGQTGGSEDEKDLSPKAMETLRLKTGFTDAEINLQQRALSFDECFMRSPIDGRVANLEAKVNNLPAAGKPFCVVLDDREFDVNFKVLESEVSRLKNGQRVLVVPFSVDSAACQGIITEINPLIDEHSMVDIRARVVNQNHKLIEGMNVKVYVRFTVPGGLIVPKEAMVLRNNRQVVFSVKNGRSYWNYVETGYENSRSYTIQVISGVLVAGDTIITKGNLNLAHDAEIELKFNEKN